jgi:uncharacterized protein YggL (DUF469 family)
MNRREKKESAVIITAAEARRRALLKLNEDPKKRAVDKFIQKVLRRAYEVSGAGKLTLTTAPCYWKDENTVVHLDEEETQSVIAILKGNPYHFDVHYDPEKNESLRLSW